MLIIMMIIILTQGKNLISGVIFSTLYDFKIDCHSILFNVSVVYCIY